MWHAYEWSPKYWALGGRPPKPRISLLSAFSPLRIMDLSSLSLFLSISLPVFFFPSFVVSLCSCFQCPCKHVGLKTSGLKRTACPSHFFITGVRHSSPLSFGLLVLIYRGVCLLINTTQLCMDVRASHFGWRCKDGTERCSGLLYSFSRMSWHQRHFDSDPCPWNLSLSRINNLLFLHHPYIDPC